MTASLQWLSIARQTGMSVPLGDNGSLDGVRHAVRRWR
ncbi:MAG: hypothetical protein OJF49_001639 [Ktedonobacterales bacterium]|nr:MAG: hypothetical protein OJF49_001639 [Ktedonobacterales bacterium]